MWTLILYLALAWDPVLDPYVTSYRVSYQAHYRTDIPCPTPETPNLMCATYWTGTSLTEIIPSNACGARCQSTVTLPYILSSEVIWFQLVAARASGCEGQTAWPPV
jgi:hypothetical protein